MLSDLVTLSTTVWEARPGIASTLPPDAKEAHYDARTAAYDRVVGSALLLVDWSPGMLVAAQCRVGTLVVEAIPQSAVSEKNLSEVREG